MCEVFRPRSNSARDKSGVAIGYDSSERRRLHNNDEELVLDDEGHDGGRLKTKEDDSEDK